MLEMVRGFTLIELIIVVVVLGILAAIAIVGYGAITKEAEESAAQANLAAFTKAIMTHHTNEGAPELTRAMTLDALANSSPGVVDGGVGAEGSWKLFGKDYLVSGPEEFAIGFAVTPGGEVNNVAGKYAVLTTSTGTKTYAHSINHHSGATAWEGVTGQVETSSTPAFLISEATANPPEPQEPEPVEGGDFVLTYDLAEPDTNVELPVAGDVLVDIDWGDGTTETDVTDTHPDHTFTDAGEHTITVTGTFTDMREGNTSVIDAIGELVSVDQWDEDTGTTTASYAFHSATNLTYVATPPSTITSMFNMFNGATAFNQDLNDWDTSNVKNMGAMFRSATEFNGDISNWNTSNVNNMGSMFHGAAAFNGDVNNWNVRRVSNMANMFHSASEFNSDLSDWRTPNLQQVSYMFHGAYSFNKPLNHLNVSLVTNMEGMFMGATAFNQNLNDWVTSNVRTMESMFNGASSFNGEIFRWNTGSVENMTYMFSDAKSFNGNLSNWNVNKVIHYAYFDHFAAFDEEFLPPFNS